ncbi:conserved hypothetical protein [Thermosulfidibacter takaii ABI70S6]|uniref:CoA-binding domain-containing protein n=1 Tax=Thermosulfidibacter takaii (strain DSM 17441 / JCM 13301 / NBRC 103674 / ABI70S6) TaxID=1298851 RepID=A0A0S3QRZ9_THET7|nr:CoA-binding protein [Thermosulfidibacter takaii]BAT71057.1 conserved hypothetical protein [Thermosulfidibacter takaii ABI70S6]
MDAQKMLEKALSWLKNYKTFAVVGATTNEDKYGFKYVKALVDEGYNVLPVNPKYQEVYSTTCYPSLKELPEQPDVVISIVAPKVSMNVAKACSDLKLERIWLPPETWNEDVLELCEKEGLDYVCNICPLMALGYLKQT